MGSIAVNGDDGVIAGFGLCRHADKKDEGTAGTGLVVPVDANLAAKEPPPETVTGESQTSGLMLSVFVMPPENKPRSYQPLPPSPGVMPKGPGKLVFPFTNAALS